MTLRQQIQIILDTHHADTKQRLPALAARIEAMRKVKAGDQQTDRLARAFMQIKAEMESHMMKEEMILFPMIERAEAGMGMTGCGVQGPVSQMLYEHREAKNLLLEMTDAVKRIDGIDPEIAAGVTWLNDDLYEHIRKEEEELFPGAMKACGAGMEV